MVFSSDDDQQLQTIPSGHAMPTIPPADIIRQRRLKNILKQLSDSQSAHFFTPPP